MIKFYGISAKRYVKMRRRKQRRRIIAFSVIAVLIALVIAFVLLYYVFKAPFLSQEGMYIDEMIPQIKGIKTVSSNLEWCENKMKSEA